MLSALSPLDGRYATKTEELRAAFSEQALMKARITVEIKYFIALANEPKVSNLPKLNAKQEKALLALISKFDATQAKEVKTIEKTTNHDVKAIEYYLKKKAQKISGLKKHIEFIHFGLTSEDVNNLSYGLMIHDALKQSIRPHLKSTIADLRKMANQWKKIRLLSQTHGQSATPTTVGKEIMVFVDRLERQSVQLNAFTMQGKFGGAVGNYASISIAYPKVKWEAFGKKFIKSLGMDPLAHTTQSNPHDDIAELSHIIHRTNSIMLDLSRDMWMYISRGVFKQKVIAGEVGSSAMPHKVNPIDFENAEGNVGLSNALFAHFAEKLPISRLQRDLSDSTVQRNIGSAFGYHLIAVQSLRKGLSKVSISKPTIKQELQDHCEVLAEPIQMILRRRGVEGAYEKLKALTRGESISKKDFIEFMEGQKFSKEEVKSVLSLLG